MLVVENEAYLAEVKKFAESVGAIDRLTKQLDYLNGYAGSDKTRCHLVSDFAPHSFHFIMKKLGTDGEYRYWFNGGLIYRGPRQPLDGSGPAFTVDISPSDATHDWSVHT